MKPIIVIASEIPLFSSKIADELKKDDFAIVYEAPGNEDLIFWFEKIRPDVLILGEVFLKTYNVTAIKTLVNEFPFMKLMVIGSCQNELIILCHYRLGISGYVYEKDALSSINLAVHCVLKGRLWVSPTIAETIIDKLLKGGNVNALTHRELSILQLLSEGKKDKEIAADLDICERTVRNSIQSIYEKIDVHSKLQAVTWASSHGLLSDWQFLLPNLAIKIAGIVIN